LKAVTYAVCKLHWLNAPTSSKKKASGNDAHVVPPEVWHSTSVRSMNDSAKKILTMKYYHKQIA